MRISKRERGEKEKIEVTKTSLTIHFHENILEVIGLASATHSKSAVSPKFTDTGSDFI